MSEEERNHRDDGLAGFTLIETLVSLVLAGVIFGALASITRQWLPNWSRGIGRVQAEEQLASGLQRISVDVAAAELVPAERQSREVFFDGTQRSVMFVRTALGPNVGPGLEVVLISQSQTEYGPELIRMRAPFIPAVQATDYPRDVKFFDPVVLLRGYQEISFAYASGARVWQPTWQQQALLPTAIKVTLHGLAVRPALAVSTATLVHVELPIKCLDAASFAACLEQHRGVFPAAGRLR